MKKGKEKLKILFAFVIGFLLSSGIVYGATLYTATEVSYDNSNSGTSKTDVQGAVDELYNLAEKSLSISVSSGVPTYTGKEGELVIMSNQEASKYYVANNEPVSPEANSVWIMEGKSGNYSVSSSNVSFPILATKQYIDSTWVKTPCFIYQNSKWNIIDRIGPVITVEGHTSDYSVTIVQNSSYTIPTGTATDNYTQNIAVTRSGSVTPSTAGTYKVTYTATDEAGNIATLALTVNVISSTYTYNYTGGVQSFTVPETGTYKLEVYGASGGNINGANGGNGGYASGNVSLTKNQTIYIVIDGRGSDGSWNASVSGGYNGGGSGQGSKDTSKYWYWGCSGGGGSTHIATTNRGVLSSYSSYQSEVLIVAGGGGGWSGGTARNLWNGGSKGGTSWTSSSLSSIATSAGQRSGNGYAVITYVG